MQPSQSTLNPNRYTMIRDERDLYRTEYHQAADQRDRQAEQISNAIAGCAACERRLAAAMAEIAQLRQQVGT